MKRTELIEWKILLIVALVIGVVFSLGAWLLGDWYFLWGALSFFGLTVGFMFIDTALQAINRR